MNQHDMQETLGNSTLGTKRLETGKPLANPDSIVLNFSLSIVAVKMCVSIGKQHVLELISAKLTHGQIFIAHN